MIFGGKNPVFLAGFLILAVAARAAVALDVENDSGNPYRHIAIRNIFDLQSVVITNCVEPVTPRPDIKVTGLTTISGRKQALLILNEAGTAGKPKTSHSLILSEGQRVGEIEVVEINLKARTVKIRCDKIALPLELCLAEAAK